MVRLARLAAGLALAVATAAQIGTPAEAAPVASEVEGAVVLQALPSHWNDALAEGSAGARLRPVGGEAGMDAAVTATAERVRLIPRFPLLEGVSYEVVLERLGELLVVPVTAADEPSPSARVVSVSPVGPALPANMLRFHVEFSTAMARGAGQAVRLETAAGERTNAVLRLPNELWSADQTRLTLYLDPGRIKRGVGPNATAGPPLDEGADYRLVVGPTARTALGRPLAAAFVHAFRAGPAERRAVDPTRWTIGAIVPGSSAPLTVRFDRVMDRPSTLIALRPVVLSGDPLAGEAASDGTLWSFAPSRPWPDGACLRIDPVLEDIAGNTLCNPFDSPAGTARSCEEAVMLDLGATPPRRREPAQAPPCAATSRSDPAGG